MLKKIDENNLFSHYKKETLKPKAISLISLYNTIFSRLKATSRQSDVKEIALQKENQKYNTFTLDPESRYCHLKLNTDTNNTNEENENYVEN